MKGKRFFYLYLAFGTLVLLGLGSSHYYGWALTTTEKAKLPASVRDNPGAYRTHYFGGK